MFFDAYLWPFRKATFSITQILLTSCLFSCTLLAARIFFTGHLSYAFLLWNLFLAFLPYAITVALYQFPYWVANKWRFTAVAVLWLLFVPNSFYIITDLFHLDRFDGAPAWFDLLLLFSFAWNGILLGVLSLRKMEWLLELRFGHRVTWAVLILVMWLNALGIFIGRYLRYNSWDIVTQPGSLLGDIIYLFRHPLRHKMEWGMIGLYAFFMLLFYITIHTISLYFSKTPVNKVYGNNHC